MEDAECRLSCLALSCHVIRSYGTVLNNSITSSQLSGKILPAIGVYSGRQEDTDWSGQGRGGGARRQLYWSWR